MGFPALKEPEVMFGNTLLKGVNKTGSLKPDENGYYKVVLGAIGVNNSVGEHYVDSPEVRNQFESNSTLMRRIKSGLLRGEYGHPDPSQYPTPMAFEGRVRRIQEDRVCMHISKVWLESIEYEGKPVTAIVGMIKPCGPYGNALKESLDNPNENVTFSGRYYSNIGVKAGVVQRSIHTVATWDYVSEPGIAISQKYMSPDLEEHSKLHITKSILSMAVDNTKRSLESGISMEGSEVITIKELIVDIGFDIGDSKTKLLNW